MWLTCTWLTELMFLRLRHDNQLVFEGSLLDCNYFTSASPLVDSDLLNYVLASWLFGYITIIHSKWAMNDESQHNLLHRKTVVSTLCVITVNYFRCNGIPVEPTKIGPLKSMKLQESTLEEVKSTASSPRIV